MIHYMGGGVIKDVGSYTFVKVVFDGEDVGYWYISDYPVREGDRVAAPRGKADMPAQGTVVKVEQNVNGQVTPIPLKAAKKIISII